MSTSIDFGIDLDAAIRETAHPEGIPVTFRGVKYTLPAEFPIDVLDPLLDPELDLFGLLRLVLDDRGDADLGEAVIEALFNRPNLPLNVLNAVYGSLRLLFGAEQFEQFQAGRPGLVTYGALIKGLFKQYGVSLGEAFASPASSETGGATSSQTSPTPTPDSTPEPSSDAPAPVTGSSESVGSATS